MRTLPKKIKDIVSSWNGNKSSFNLKKFKAKIIFKVGRNGNSFLFFDSLVNMLLMKSLLKSDFYNLSIDFDEAIELELPIKKIFFNENDFFYSSGGIFDIPDNTSFGTKRTEEPILPIIKEKRVRLNAGTLKNYKRVVLYSSHKEYVVRGIGDIDILKDLFEIHFNIGKRGNEGFGECSVEIEQDKDIDSKCLRPIPFDYLQSKNVVIDSEEFYCPARPPYFGKHSIKYRSYMYDLYRI